MTKNKIAPFKLNQVPANTFTVLEMVIIQKIKDLRDEADKKSKSKDKLGDINFGRADAYNNVLLLIDKP